MNSSKVAGPNRHRDNHGRRNDPEKAFRSCNWATRGGPLVNGKRHFVAAGERYHPVSLAYAAQTILAPEPPSFLLDQCDWPIQVRIYC
jgi:hypothetical protein